MFCDFEEIYKTDYAGIRYEAHLECTSTKFNLPLRNSIESCVKFNSSKFSLYVNSTDFSYFIADKAFKFESYVYNLRILVLVDS